MPDPIFTFDKEPNLRCDVVKPVVRLAWRPLPPQQATPSPHTLQDTLSVPNSYQEGPALDAKRQEVVIIQLNQ